MLSISWFHAERRRSPPSGRGRNAGGLPRHGVKLSRAAMINALDTVVLRLIARGRE